LTIELRAQDFYQVILDEGEARNNFHFVEIESANDLIAAVESEIRHETIHIQKREPEDIFFNKNVLVLLLALSVEEYSK
jgi:hypothetical protein